MGVHFHAYIEKEKPWNYKSPNCLDLKINDNVYHGIYEKVKDKIEIIKYIIK